MVGCIEWRVSSIGERWAEPSLFLSFEFRVASFGERWAEPSLQCELAIRAYMPTRKAVSMAPGYV